MSALHADSVLACVKRRRMSDEAERAASPSFLMENATRAAATVRAKPAKTRKASAAADRVNPLDQYFTDERLVDLALERTKACLDAAGVVPQTYFDPSAGSGRVGAAVQRFWPGIDLVQWDLEPRGAEIAQRNFIESPVTAADADGWRHPVLGGFNPPFGKSSHLAKRFVEFMAPVCDYIVMIVPPKVAATALSQHNEPLEVLFAQEVENLFAGRAGAGTAKFWDVALDKPMNVDVALFIGRRRLVALTRAEISHKSTRVELHDTSTPEHRDPADVLVVRVRGHNAGRTAWVFDGDDVKMVDTPDRKVPLRVQRPSFARPNYAFVRPLAGAPTVDWHSVARHFVCAPLPRYTAMRVTGQGMLTHSEAAQMLD